MTDKPKKRGRPPLDPKDRKPYRFNRIAVYKSTHARIKTHAKNADKPMIDWLEEEIKPVKE